jgi:anaerobic ribonucleoside-triphosphate reductase activating protein
MNGGEEMAIDEIIAIVEENGFNVTFSGGDPIYQLNALIPLAYELHKRGYNIWCYTGFSFEELLDIDGIDTFLNLINVIVDGPFVSDLRDTSLRFRGSANQRLIDVTHSDRKHITMWHDDD